ncbi:hypothetical protein H6768_03275 [Candidatus Peribacteria bacterium]|nr:hypothetical protein [Candidatus Peribacteria bacterium]
MNKYFLYIFLGLYVGTVFSCTLFTSYSFASSIGFSVTIRPIPECQNRIDDDGDGFIDYPADDDCSDENGTESTIDDTPTQS